jgi:uncharacterized protein
VQIENAFEVPAPVDVAWELITDVERIAPCMPGAEITEALGDGRYRGRAQVRLGPVTMRFAGEAHYLERDQERRMVRLSATGRDQSGRGNAKALITSRLVPSDGATTVEIVTDLQLSGAVAQFGRQGIVSDVSSALIGQFADCLSQRLAAPAPELAPAEAPTSPPRAPRLPLLAILRQVLTGIVRRLRERLVERRRR